MKKEDLIALGLDEETATKVAQASAEELKGFIPKARFDEVNTQKNEYQTKFEELSKSTGDTEELKKQIDDAKAEMETKENEYQERIKNLTIDSALKLAVADSVHDADIVTELLKKDGVELDDKGNVKDLENKVNTLKESKPFLFKEQQAPQPNPQGQQTPPFQFPGKVGTGRQDPPAPTGAATLSEAIAEKVFSGSNN